jgi:hypothetical protein
MEAIESFLERDVLEQDQDWFSAHKCCTARVRPYKLGEWPFPPTEKLAQMYWHHSCALPQEWVTLVVSLDSFGDALIELPDPVRYPVQAVDLDENAWPVQLRILLHRARCPEDIEVVLAALDLPFWTTGDIAEVFGA